jgi:LytS/YehU family sensor histidine kinase
MLKGGLTQVTVQEEMQHVQNYIRMQELRYPDRIFYMCDIMRELQTHPIPRFLIHTFVENTFKHALSDKEMLSIFIKVDTVAKNGQPYVQITVEDDGDGFPDDVLREFQERGADHQDRGDKVGILNVRRTLKLLYKQDDLLQLTNIEPSGARVVIFIPAQQSPTLSA